MKENVLLVNEELNSVLTQLTSSLDDTQIDYNTYVTVVSRLVGRKEPTQSG